VVTTTAIVPSQSWIARTALGWTVSDLASAARMSRDTVMRFERGEMTRAATGEAIQRALEGAGIVFIEAKDGGPGAKLRSQSTKRKR
jgi:transcriptional regulator with XRE-family HTH domain